MKWGDVQDHAVVEVGFIGEAGIELLLVTELQPGGSTEPLCDKKDKKRAGIAADAHPAGTPGATGVERLRPRENGQRWGGGERGKMETLH